MELFASTLVYAGLCAVFLGFISLIWPLRFMAIASRAQGTVVFLCGVAVVSIGFLLPAQETKIETQEMQLDRFAPTYQFHEFHSIRLHAPHDRVFRAIKEVRASEIFLFRTLTWMRRFGRHGPESILNPGQGLPLLDVATRSGFLWLAEESEREIVLGTLVAAPPGWRPKGKPTPEDFRALHAPGFALAAMNFRLEDAGSDATILTTETRVYATDASARRRFAPYWRTIYPGSALIRRMWLRAIKQRAEKMAG